MTIHRVRMGICAMALGAVASLVPTAPAWAGSSRTSGSDPHSAFCQLEKQSTSGRVSKLTTAATTALIKGNWPLAQKDLLAIDTQTGKLEHEFIAALSSAPANVRKAANAVVKEVPAEERAIRDSTSVSQYESTETAAIGSTFTGYATTIANYETSTCGSAATSF